MTVGQFLVSMAIIAVVGGLAFAWCAETARTVGGIVTLLRRLITRVRIYFARRRIWRALAAEQELRDSPHWIMACNACGIREVAVGRGRCEACVEKPNFGAMADLNLANWWKRWKRRKP